MAQVLVGIGGIKVLNDDIPFAQFEVEQGMWGLNDDIPFAQ
ncbi:hypothetical protein [Cohnella sp.]